MARPFILPADLPKKPCKCRVISPNTADGKLQLFEISKVFHPGMAVAEWLQRPPHWRPELKPR
jgi:hypothetical protein